MFSFLFKKKKYIQQGRDPWFQNDQLHRTDGPAVIRSDGSKDYWNNGKELTPIETIFNTNTNTQ